MMKKRDVEILIELHIFSTPEYEHIVYVRKYCKDEQIDLEILTELHVFTTFEYSDF